VLALQAICEERDIVSAQQIEAKMQELDLDATTEIELGSQHEEFRRLRRLIQEQAENDPEEPS